MEKLKKSLIIGCTIIGLSTIIATLILTRPGADVDTWVVFSTAIIYPLVSIFLLITWYNKEKDDK